MSRIEIAPSISKQVIVRSRNSHDDVKLCVDPQRGIWSFDDQDRVPAAILEPYED